MKPFLINVTCILRCIWHTYIIRVQIPAPPYRADVNFNGASVNTFYEVTNPSRNRCVFITSLIVGERTLIYLFV
jgi:hypothetical protein